MAHPLIMPGDKNQDAVQIHRWSAKGVNETQCYFWKQKDKEIKEGKIRIRKIVDATDNKIKSTENRNRYFEWITPVYPLKEDTISEISHYELFDATSEPALSPSDEEKQRRKKSMRRHSHTTGEKNIQTPPTPEKVCPNCHQWSDDKYGGCARMPKCKTCTSVISSRKKKSSGKEKYNKVQQRSTRRKSSTTPRKRLSKQFGASALKKSSSPKRKSRPRSHQDSFNKKPVTTLSKLLEKSQTSGSDKQPTPDKSNSSKVVSSKTSSTKVIEIHRNPPAQKSSEKSLAPKSASGKSSSVKSASKTRLDTQSKSVAPTTKSRRGSTATSAGLSVKTPSMSLPKSTAPRVTVRSGSEAPGQQSGCCLLLLKLLLFTLLLWLVLLSIYAAILSQDASCKAQRNVICVVKKNCPEPDLSCKLAAFLMGAIETPKEWYCTALVTPNFMEMCHQQ